MLHVEDIRFSYGRKKILDGISFDAEKGEVVSLLGPNGVGKTTLLKCMCNIHRPESGRVEVDGRDVLELSGKELAKNIGYVPQSVPRSRTTVFDSVLIGRHPYIDLTVSDEDVKKTGQVIDAFRMSDLALSYVSEISGGEFQKVQIARAIVQEPKVLILDEPTNNLDVSNQHMTMHMVMDIVRSSGVCTLMTMHDINLAVHYSDRLMFVKDGNIAEYGGPEIVTESLIRDVYGIESDVINHKGLPFVIPHNVQPGFRIYEHSNNHEHPHDVSDHVHELFKDNH